VFKIYKLNELTIPYIKKLAKECNIELKKGKKAYLIKQINNFKIPEEKLSKLIEKLIKEKKTTLKPNSAILSFETRIKNLEDQMAQIIIIINNMNENHWINNSTSEKPFFKDIFIENKKEINSIEDIKNFIQIILKIGDSITIDKLIKVKELQNVSLSLLKDSIKELIENKVLEAFDGVSTQKINGYIGKLIRKK